MTFIVHYVINGRSILGGNFTSRRRCDAFCEWLATDGITFTVEETRAA